MSLPLAWPTPPPVCERGRLWCPTPTTQRTERVGESRVQTRGDARREAAAIAGVDGHRRLQADLDTLRADGFWKPMERVIRGKNINGSIARTRSMVEKLVLLTMPYISKAPPAPIRVSERPISLQLPPACDGPAWAGPRTTPLTIVDVFPFGWELDLLEIRLCVFCSGSPCSTNRTLCPASFPPTRSPYLPSHSHALTLPPLSQPRAVLASPLTPTALPASPLTPTRSPCLPSLTGTSWRPSWTLSSSGAYACQLCSAKA